MKERSIVQCSACGADIFFILSRKKRWVPIDKDIIQADGKTLLWVDEITGFKMLSRGRFGYISHFETCPKASYFRTKKDHQTYIKKDSDNLSLEFK